MTPAMISLIVTGVVILFIVIGILGGLISGFARSISKGVIQIIIILVLLFSVPAIADWIINLDISAFKLSPRDIEMHTILQWIEDFIKSEDSLHGLAPIFGWDSYELILKVPLLLINSVLFVILYIIFSLIFTPLLSLIANLTISPLKKRKKDGTLRKKHRALGMIPGLITGLLVCSVVMSPLIGLVDTINAANAEAKAKGREGVFEMIFADSETDAKEYQSYVDGYNSSPGKQMLRYTGMEALGQGYFNYLSTFKHGEEKVNLKETILSGLSVYFDIDDLMKLANDDISQADLDLMLPLVRSISNQVFDLPLVKMVSTDLIPYIFNGMLDGDGLIPMPNIDNELVSELVIEGLTEFGAMTIGYLQHDVNSFLDIMDKFNQENILISLINQNDSHSLIGPEDKPYALIPSFNDELIDFTTEKMGQMYAFGIAPLIIKAVVTMAADVLGITDLVYHANDSDYQSIIGILNTSLKATVAIFSTTGFDIDTKHFVLEETLPYFGRILDSVKAYLDVPIETDHPDSAPQMTTFDQLIYGMKPMIIDHLDKLTFGAGQHIPADLLASLTICVDNLPLVEHFEDEFTRFAFIIKNMNALTDTKNIDLDLIGQALDLIKPTILFGSEFRSILSSFMDYALTTIKNNQHFNNFVPIIETFKDNVVGYGASCTGSNCEQYSFQVALAPLSGLITVFQSIGSETDVNQAVNDGILLEIGIALDDAKTSELFGTLANEISIQMLELVRDNVISFGDNRIDTAINSMYDSLEANITNLGITMNFAVEFGKLNDLVELTKELPSDLSHIDEIYDLVDKLYAISDANPGDPNAEPPIPPTPASQVITISLIDTALKGITIGYIDTAYEGLPEEIKTYLGPILDKLENNINSFESTSEYGLKDAIRPLGSLVETFEQLSDKTDVQAAIDDGMLITIGDTLDEAKTSELFGTLANEITVALLNVVKDNTLPAEGTEVQEAFKRMYDRLGVNVMDSGIDLDFSVELGKMNTLYGYTKNFASTLTDLSQINELIDEMYYLAKGDDVAVPSVPSSKVITYQVIDDTLKEVTVAFLDETFETLGDNPTLSKVSTIIEELKTNITNFNDPDGAHPFGDALKPLENLTNVFIEVNKSSDLPNALKEGLLVEIGGALNQAKTSPLVGTLANDTAVAMVEIIRDNLDLENKDNPTPMDEVLITMFDMVIDNIETAGLSLDFAVEFEKMIELVNISDRINSSVNQPLVIIGLIEEMMLVVDGDPSAEPPTPPSQIITEAVVNVVIDQLVKQALEENRRAYQAMLDSLNLDPVMENYCLGLYDQIANSIEQYSHPIDKLNAIENIIPQMTSILNAYKDDVLNYQYYVEQIDLLVADPLNYHYPM